MTSENTETQKKTSPDFYVHAVVPNGRKNRVGASIGRVFNHKNGTGFSIYLDAIPIAVDGQIELVAYVPKP